MAVSTLDIDFLCLGVWLCICPLCVLHLSCLMFSKFLGYLIYSLTLTLENFQSNFFKTFPLSFSFSSFLVFQIVQYFPTVPGWTVFCFCFEVFFCSCFSLQNFYWFIFKSTNSLFLSSLLYSLMACFMSVTMLFISSI